MELDVQRVAVIRAAAAAVAWWAAGLRLGSSQACNFLRYALRFVFHATGPSADV